VISTWCKLIYKKGGWRKVGMETDKCQIYLWHDESMECTLD